MLHCVGYEDKGRVRPVVYRASLSEMVVPYGDPRPHNFRRNAFDLGEYGIGMLTNSLVLGCDCLGEILLLRRSPSRHTRQSGEDTQRHLYARGGTTAYSGSIPTGEQGRSR